MMETQLREVWLSFKLCQHLRALAKPAGKETIRALLRKARQPKDRQELEKYLTTLANYSGQVFWRSSTVKKGQAYARSMLPLVAQAQNGTLPQELTSEEIAIIKNGNLQRGNGGRVILLGFGHEKYLSLFFRREHIYDRSCYRSELSPELLNNYIKGKRVLVVSGYGPNAFLFKMLGAKEVVGVDADPISIAWLKAIAKYFHNDNIGNIILSTAEYPNSTASSEISRIYKDLEESIVLATQQKVRTGSAGDPIEGVSFTRAFLGVPEDNKECPSIRAALAGKGEFDFIYVPYLLGIENGISDRAAIVKAFMDFWSLAKPGARIMITPFSDLGSGLASYFGCRQDPGLLDALKDLVPQNKFRFIDHTNIDGARAEVLEPIK